MTALSVYTLQFYMFLGEDGEMINTMLNVVKLCRGPNKVYVWVDTRDALKVYIVRWRLVYIIVENPHFNGGWCFSIDF